MNQTRSRRSFDGSKISSPDLQSMCPDSEWSRTSDEPTFASVSDQRKGQGKEHQYRNQSEDAFLQPFQMPSFDSESDGSFFGAPSLYSEQTGSFDQAPYQVSSDVDQETKRQKSKAGIILLTVASVLFIVLGLSIVFQEQLSSFFGISFATPEPEQPAISETVTPAPAKAYDASAQIEFPENAVSSAEELLEGVTAETALITETNIVMRSPVSKGLYDYYFFSADTGKLLCYFDHLDSNNLIPLEGNLFYVDQYPFLITEEGKPAVRGMNSSVDYRVHPMYHGFSVVSKLNGNAQNYLNLQGELLSSLWFQKAYPFTGKYTLACVDTGVDGDQRYLLYLVFQDGTMMRWFSSASPDLVLTCACCMACMANGEIYCLPAISAPMTSTTDIKLYLNCDAAVLLDPVLQKYSLYVHGEQQYGYEYDSIFPVSGDLSYLVYTVSNENTTCTLYAVNGQYPLPRSYSFALEKDGLVEYVSLSADSVFPILLNEDF